MINLNRIIELTNEFLEIPSSISFEKPFLDYLEKKAKNLGYNIFRKENSYLVIKPKNDSIVSSKLFSVHIDRHSVIKNDNGRLEYLAFNLKKKLGLPFLKEEVKISEENLLLELEEREVSFEKFGEFLVFKREGFKPVKLKRDGLDTYYETVALRFTKEDCISYDFNSGEKINEYKLIRNQIDINKNEIYFFTNKTIGFDEKIFMIKSKIYQDEKFISGQIDNVISVAVLFYLLEKGNFNEEIIFTTKEEIGLSYKCVIDYINSQDNFEKKLIILDTSPYSNIENEKSGFLTLRYGDENGGFNSELVLKIKSILEENQINFDFKPSFLGRTELGRVSSESQGKVNGSTLQLPSMNYHTVFETCSKTSLENFVFIIEKLLE